MTQSTPLYDISRQGQKLGPYSLETIHLEIKDRRLSQTDLFSISGMENWQPLTLLVTSGSVYANWSLRIAAYLLDCLVLLLIAIFVLGGFWIYQVNFSNQSAADTSGIDIILSVIKVALNGVFAAYFIILIGGGKQSTFGMRLLGIRVHQLSGKPMSYSLAAANWFLFCILTCATLLINFFVPWFTEKKQGLHDLITGTVYYKS